MSQVGPAYDEHKKKELVPIIEEKYKNQLYPGYQDSGKPDGTKYNDAFIWLQTIEYSKENQKDIIFVTGDLKEDWWNINKETKKRTIKKPMINDFMVSTGQRIQLLTLDEFFDKYNKQLPDEEKVDSKQMKDILEYIKINDRRDITNQFYQNDYRPYAWSNMSANYYDVLWNQEPK